MHYRMLRDAGVSIITENRGERRMDDFVGLLTTVIDQHTAHDESRKVSERSVSGKIAKAKRGQRVSGALIFGFDREYIDETGKVVKLVSHDVWFRKPSGWSCRLVPTSDQIVTESIRYAFESMASGRGSFASIAKYLNGRGLQTLRGNEFESQSVKAMLTNPVYAGVLRVGQHAKGQFNRTDSDGIILYEEAHPRIVSREVFQRAQEVIKGRSWNQGRRGEYSLSGRVYCAHCGSPMYGMLARTSRGRRDFRNYKCSGNGRGRRHNCPDCPNMNADRLEAAVIKVLQQHLLKREVLDDLQAVASGREEQTPEDSQLAELDRRIELAGDNMVFAETPEDRALFSKKLAELREQRREIARRIRQSGDNDRAPALSNVLKMLKAFRDDLPHLDSSTMRQIAVATIERIEVGRDVIHDGQASYRDWYGTVVFLPDVLIAPVELDKATLNPQDLWRRVHHVLTSKPQRVREIAEAVGRTDHSNVRAALQIAQRRGFAERVGFRTGWIATS